MKRILLSILIILSALTPALSFLAVKASPVSIYGYQYSPLFGFYGLSTIGTSPRYGSLSSELTVSSLQSSNTTVEQYIPDSYGIESVDVGIFSNLNIYLLTAPGVGESVTVTLYVNDSPTSLAATISDTNTSASSASQYAAVQHGDKVYYRVDSTGTTAAGLKTTIYYQSYSGDRQVILGQRKVYTNTSVNSLFSATGSTFVSPWPVSGVISHLYVDGSGGTENVTLRVNGSPTSLAVAYTGSAVYDVTTLVGVTEGDTVDIYVAGDTTATLFISAVFTPSSPGWSAFQHRTNGWTTGNGNYYPLTGGVQTTLNTVWIAGVDGKMGHWYLTHDPAASPAETVNMRIYKNESLTAVNFGGTNSGDPVSYSDSSQVTTSAGDRILAYYSSSYALSDNWMWSYGVYVTPPQASTQLASVFTHAPETDWPRSSVVYMVGHVGSMGSENALLVSFDYGVSTNYTGSANADPRTYHQASITKPFKAIIPNISPDVTYHYRAKAVGTSGTTYYGNDIAFMLSSANVPLVETITADQIDLTSVRSGVKVLDLGLNTTMSLYIQVGTTTSYTFGDQAGDTVSTPGSYYINITGLTENTRYHYRAKAVGDNSTAYGYDKTFRTHNSNSPALVNKANDWFEANGWDSVSAWWVMLILLIVIAWLFLAWDKLGRVIATAITFLLIGAWVVLGLVDIWLVIILAITAGAIMALIVFNGRQAVSSG